MALEVALFLRQKLLDTLKKPDQFPRRLSNLSKEFQEIQKIIPDESEIRKIILSSNANSKALLEKLQDLHEALVDCINFVPWHQELTQTSCLLNPFQQMCFLSNDMKGQLGEMKRRLGDFVMICRNLSSPDIINFTTSRHESNSSQIFGFDKQEEEIVALLSKADCNAIGVYGMSGSGKSALVEKVLHNPTVSKAFFPVIWVSLSDINSKDDGDIEMEIVKYILCELGSDADRWINTPDKTELLKILKTSLMPKKYLLVFDDVWGKNNFYANIGLGDAKPGTNKVENQLSDALPRDGGGKIIVTSRLREVAENMVGQKNLIHMKPLEPKNCSLILEAGIRFHQYVNKIESLLIESILNDSRFMEIGIYWPRQSNTANTALIHRVLNRVLDSASVGEMFEVEVQWCKSNIFMGIQIEMLNYKLEVLESKDELQRAHGDDSKLLEIVKEKFSQSKKYLSVLVDWENDEKGFDRDLVRLLFELRQNGKDTVIVPSGILETTQEMLGLSGNKIHVIDERSEDTTHGQHVMEDIAGKCQGLPLAAKTLAKIIGEKGHDISVDRILWNN